MNRPGLPILYSFRRCPYAMRARLALYTSAIECELREVVLRDKPPEMIAVSPKATVPVLEIAPGTVIDESLTVMLWALERNDPENWMEPGNATVDQMMALIAEADGGFKDDLDRYKYPDRYDNDATACFRTQGEVFLKKLDGLLQQSDNLLGVRASLADFAIAPFVRQFANTDREWFDTAPYPALQRWLRAFLASSRFHAIMDKYPQWKAGDPVTRSPVMGAS